MDGRGSGIRKFLKLSRKQQRKRNIILKNVAYPLILNNWIIYSYIASIHMSLKLAILLILKSMFLTLTFTLKLTTEED